MANQTSRGVEGKVPHRCRRERGLRGGQRRSTGLGVGAVTVRPIGPTSRAIVGLFVESGATRSRRRAVRRDRLAILGGGAPSPASAVRGPAGGLGSKMPTILRVAGFRFFFYSNERGEPAHVHVDQAERYAAGDLRPVLFWSEDLAKHTVSSKVVKGN